jgi:hypothetical protein
MWHDPIVEEVHAVRQALLKQFNGDTRAISQHGAQLAQELGLRSVAPRPRYTAAHLAQMAANNIVTAK